MKITSLVVGKWSSQRACGQGCRQRAFQPRSRRTQLNGCLWPFSRLADYHGQHCRLRFLYNNELTALEVGLFDKNTALSWL